MIRTVGFLQKLLTINDVTKYRRIPVSRYFSRRYIIVGISYYRASLVCTRAQ